MELYDTSGQSFTWEGPLPEGLASEPSTSDWEEGDVLGDTGATHHVTGNASLLTDLVMLTEPVSLRVAINTPSAFITGQGSLLIKDDWGKTLTVCNMYYCAEAWQTLLSMAALQEEGHRPFFDLSGNLGTEFSNLVSSTAI